MADWVSVILSPNGEVVTINRELVRYIGDSDRGGSVITFDKDHAIVVIEKPIAILNAPGKS